MKDCAVERFRGSRSRTKAGQTGKDKRHAPTSNRENQGNLKTNLNPYWPGDGIGGFYTSKLY
jgi:hypothetical protein